MGMERASRCATAVATLPEHDALRPLALAAAALVSIAGYLALHPLAPAGLGPPPGPAPPLVVPLGLPYRSARWLLPAAPGASAGGWRRPDGRVGINARRPV